MKERDDEKYIVVQPKPDDRPDTGFARAIVYIIVIVTITFTTVVLYFMWRGIYVQDSLITAWFASFVASLIGVVSVIKKAAHEKHKDYRSTYHHSTYYRRGPK